ncbi:AAA family ATPase [Riemerella columbipharyngis]|uniref:DNA transposition protein, AAA+ family ATPase n=1 Tax=Riemerella columbipharyngis TaxID=1071918 RepID=A0A1G7FBL8_9FLAO|nr:AAA family ATPase [Riemerella columbipharyngis]SDE73330.1 DNA transposition protein, AAA+ family ATPase [Riemerella columbipharyngis]
MITEEQKTSIATELFRLAGNGKKKRENFKFSQVELSVKLGISNGTVSNMIAGKWNNIADSMWRKVQASLRIDTNWNTAETSNFKLLTELLSKAQETQLTAAISYDAGIGKSEAYKQYERKNDNVIYVECKNYWQTKSYIKALLNACGVKAEGTKEEMINTFVDYVMGLESPLIIIDQMDKLKEGAFDLFMDLYNDLFRCCGFIISGVPALEKRIIRGAKIDKIGYKEVLSRLGGTFIKLNPTSLADVIAICEANGLHNTEEAEMIYQLSNGDLRVVRQKINKYFLLNKVA